MTEEIIKEAMTKTELEAYFGGIIFCLESFKSKFKDGNALAVKEENIDNTILSMKNILASIVERREKELTNPNNKESDD